MAGKARVKALAPYYTIYGLDIVQPQKEGVKKTFSWDALEELSAESLELKEAEIRATASKCHPYLPSYR